MTRSPEEFARIYHSDLRRDFVAHRKCLACKGKQSGMSENHHTRNGGTSRKGNYDTIVPLCLKHHAEYHHRGRDTVSLEWGLDWDEEAKKTEEAWKAYDDESLF